MRSKLLLAGCCLLTACGDSAIETAQTKVAESLINPATAEFSNLSETGSCVDGMVDGENRMGSLAGATPFVFLSETEEVWIADSDDIKNEVVLTCARLKPEDTSLTKAYERVSDERLAALKAEFEELKRSWTPKTVGPDPISGDKEIQLFHLAENMDGSDRQHSVVVFCSNDSKLSMMVDGFSVSDHYDYDSSQTQIKIGDKEAEDAGVILGDDGQGYFFLEAAPTGRKIITGLSEGEDIILRLRSEYGTTVRTLKFYGEKFPAEFEKLPETCVFDN